MSRYLLPLINYPFAIKLLAVQGLSEFKLNLNKYTLKTKPTIFLIV